MKKIVFFLLLCFLFPAIPALELEEEFLRFDRNIPITSADPEIYTYTHDGTWTVKKHSDKGDVIIEIPFVEKTGMFTKEEWGHIKTLGITYAFISGILSMVGIWTVEYFYRT